MIDQMLIWEIEGVLYKYLIDQLDNYAQSEFEFGQRYLF